MANYVLYSVENNTVKPLVASNPLLQNVVWSPIDHKVAYLLLELFYFYLSVSYSLALLFRYTLLSLICATYVYDDNIYVYDASSDTTYTVTTDGNAENGILNGVR